MKSTQYYKCLKNLDLVVVLQPTSEQSNYLAHKTNRFHSFRPKT